MSKLTLIFPIACIIFILLIFADYLPVLKKGSEKLSLPGAKKYSNVDRLLIFGITLAYAVTAFVNLGSFSAPGSFCKFEQRGEYALIELDEPRDIGTVVYYTGLCTGDYYLQFSSDGENWADQPGMPQKFSDLFKWKSAELGENCSQVRFIRIISGGRLWLGEIAIFDTDGNMLDAGSMDIPEGCAALFDEQDTVPAAASYLNSSYFDEIYHARTAYEHIQGGVSL